MASQWLAFWLSHFGMNQLAEGREDTLFDFEPAQYPFVFES